MVCHCLYTMLKLHNIQGTFSRHINSKATRKVQKLFEGITAKDRASLAKSITLVESTNRDKQKFAQELLSLVATALQTEEKRRDGVPTSFRIGLSGPPGAGKSTFIETLGKQLTAAGHRLAVLAVDPSSNTTGGSLLGDKTRMPRLTVDPAAYIRASPTGGHLGGVTRNTNDTILLCEQARYDVVIVETVGVGQSEISVSDMVDVFVLLLPPAGGDELQGLKRGIVELADVIAINKSDGSLAASARHVQAEYMSALKFVRPRWCQWRPPVLRVSSRTGDGVQELWSVLMEYRARAAGCGRLAERRRHQRRTWLWEHLRAAAVAELLREPSVAALLPPLQAQVEAGRLPAGAAADRLLAAFLAGRSGGDS